MDIQPIQKSDKPSRDWRKTNDLIAELRRATAQIARHESAIAELRRRPLISAPGGGGECKRFKVVSVQTNYLTCNPYNAGGTVDTGTTVYVAKPPVLRDADAQRTRTVGSSTVTEEIRTQYATNDDIYALESSVPTGVVDGSSNPVTWLDLNVDGRNWQPKFVVLQGCEAGVTKYRQVVAGTSYT